MRTKGTGNRFCFVARVTDDPYTNKDLRTALKYAIDREKIIEQVYSGFAVPGNDHTLDALNPFYNTAMPQMKYDPDKAAFHFKKAGVSGAARPADVGRRLGLGGRLRPALPGVRPRRPAFRSTSRRCPATATGTTSGSRCRSAPCTGAAVCPPTRPLTQVFGEKSDWNDTNWKVPAFAGSHQEGARRDRRSQAQRDVLRRRRR